MKRILCLQHVFLYLLNCTPSACIPYSLNKSVFYKQWQRLVESWQVVAAAVQGRGDGGTNLDQGGGMEGSGPSPETFRTKRHLIRKQG